MKLSNNKIIILLLLFYKFTEFYCKRRIKIQSFMRELLLNADQYKNVDGTISWFSVNHISHDRSHPALYISTIPRYSCQSHSHPKNYRKGDQCGDVNAANFLRNCHYSSIHPSNLLLTMYYTFIDRLTIRGQRSMVWIWARMMRRVPGEFSRMVTAFRRQAGRQAGRMAEIAGAKLRSCHWP